MPALKARGLFAWHFQSGKCISQGGSPRFGDDSISRHVIYPKMMADVSTSPASRETPGLEIRSILLLDDDPDLSIALKDLLESRNFLVTTVESGVEGLREVMATDFDVIICDMMMPRMPGDMFYRAVERTKPHLCARFVFITGHSGNPKIADFIEMVRGLVLFKPVLIEDLIGMVSVVLNRSRGASGAS